MEISNRLTYELTPIEDAIDALLDGRALTEAEGTALANECTRLKKTFIRCISGKERTLLEDHFRLHYRMVRGWCEEVYEVNKEVQVTSAEGADLTLEPVSGQKNADPHGSHDPGLRMTHFFLPCLDDLLHFMEKHLSDYLPEPEYLTRYRMDNELESLEAAVHALQAGAEEAGVDQALWTAITDSLTMRGSVPKEVPASQVGYAKGLVGRIGWFLKRVPVGEDATEGLTRMLLQANLNSGEFYGYCVQKVQVDDLPLHEQQAYYIGLQTEMVAVYREPGEAFNTEAPHIAEQLYRSYGEEVAGLRRLEKINLRLEYRIDPEDAFRSTLTARQLALFTRLLIHTGLILVDHPRRLFDFVCRHFRSVGTDRMSTDSFYKNAHKKLAKDVQRMEVVTEQLKEAATELSS